MKNTQAKHTPGPWVIDHLENGETRGTISANDGVTHVCTTLDAAYHNAIARGQNEPATRFLLQAHANARLIAAAPAMLVALSAALETLDEGAAMNGPENAVFRRHCQLQSAQIRAAISKAEGVK